MRSFHITKALLIVVSIACGPHLRGSDTRVVDESGIDGITVLRLRESFSESFASFYEAFRQGETARIYNLADSEFQEIVSQDALAELEFGSVDYRRGVDLRVAFSEIILDSARDNQFVCLAVVREQTGPQGRERFWQMVWSYDAPSQKWKYGNLPFAVFSQIPAKARFKW